jgi:hypothetical protein
MRRWSGEIATLAADGAHTQLIRRLRARAASTRRPRLGCPGSRRLRRAGDSRAFMGFVGLVPSELLRRTAAELDPGPAGARLLLVDRPEHPPANRRPAPARRQRDQDPAVSRARGAASGVCIAAGNGWPGAASPTWKIVIACARELVSCGRSPPTSRSGRPGTTATSACGGGRSPRGEPRTTYAAPAPPGRPATLDRGGSRLTPVMVPTRGYQSDPTVAAGTPPPRSRHQRHRAGR